MQSMVISETVNPESLPLSLAGDNEDQDPGPDIFERRNSSDSGTGDNGQQGDEESVLSSNIQDQPEELPIELASLTDRYHGASPFTIMSCDIC